jgi:hypothetical protein
LEFRVAGRNFTARLILGASVVVVCVFVFLWLSKRKSDSSPPPPPAIAQSSYADSKLSSATDTPPPSSAAPLDKVQARAVEVCGIGRRSLDKSHSIVDPDLDARVAKDTRRWRSALLNSTDVRARAVGLYLESNPQATPTRQMSPEEATDSLKQLAQESGDPAVYALALNACGGLQSLAPPARCGALSLQGWTKIDADNAAAWLSLANAAREANDSVAEGAAFARAVGATKVETYNSSLLAFAENDMPTDVTPIERWEMTVNMDAAMPSSPVIAKTPQYCSAENTRQGVTRDQCSQLADLLVTHGDLLGDILTGTLIGTRVGWPQTRIASLKEEREALHFIDWQSVPTEVDRDWTCESVASRNVYLLQRSRLGETGAAREFIGQSGRTMRELAERDRDFVKGIQTTQ